MADVPLAVETPSAGRRSFLGALLALGSAGIGALLALPLGRLALFPTWRTTTDVLWSSVGPVDAFAALTAPAMVLVKVEQRDGWRKVLSTKPVYVVRGADGRLRVLSSVCPHLGCAVAWNENAGHFACPCHAGVFAADGALVSGPPPRRLDELPSTIENGQLQVRYQYFRQLVPSREVIA